MKFFVISDLHLGGRPHDQATMGVPGSQICHSYRDLTRFIHWVAQQGGADNPVELVINGDIVDFLMEDDYGPDNESAPWLPDEGRVIEKFQQIIVRTREEAGEGPFEAMADLLKAGHALTFILGNHDVELSLPAVRKYLEEEVLHVGSGGRFRFIYDGEAYVRGDLLIEHGNRYDAWNIIDHSALRQERSMLSRGLGEQMLTRPSGHFEPPPGSVMVTKVINALKRSYPFVDLLKPETKVVVPILLILHPNLQFIIKAILQNYKSKANITNGPAEPAINGQLSVSNFSQDYDLKNVLESVLGDQAENWFHITGDSSSPLSALDTWQSVKELSANIECWLHNAENLFENAMAIGGRGLPLLIALKKWRGELALRTDVEEPEYLDAAQEIAKAGKFSCIVFGHTHLPKQIMFDIEGRTSTYINTGTWADIMEVPKEIIIGDLIDSTVLQQFLNNLKTNNLEEYITRRLSYAEIVFDGLRVIEANLRQFD